MKLKKIVKALVGAGLLTACGAALADPVSIGLSLATMAAGTSAWAYAFFAANVIYSTAKVRREQRKANAQARAQWLAGLQDRNVTALRSAIPARVVYGRCIVGGDIVAMFTTDKQGTKSDGSSYTRPDALRHLVVCIAKHEVDAINDAKIDGISTGPYDANGWSLSPEFSKTTQRAFRVTIAAGGNWTAPAAVTIESAGYTQGAWDQWGTASYTLSNGNRTITNNEAQPIQVAGSYSVSESRVRVDFHTGAAGQTVNTYLNGLIPTKWTSNHRLRGHAYAVITLDLEEQRFQAGPPQITFDVTGKKLYDPRTTQTVWSANSALAIRDFLTSKYGYNVTAAEVDDTSVSAAANVCDEVVSYSIGNLQLYSGNFNANWTKTNTTAADSYANGPKGIGRGWASGASRLIETTANGVHTAHHAVTLGSGTINTVGVRVKRDTSGTRNIDLELRNAATGFGFSVRADLSTGAVLSTSTSGGSTLANKGVEYLGDGWFFVWASGTIDGGATGGRIVVSMVSGTSLSYTGSTSQALLLYGAQVNEGASPTEFIDSVNGPREARFTCNGHFQADGAAREAILSDLERSMAGFTWYGSKWQLMAGSYTAPVMAITDDDLDGDIAIAQSDTSPDELFNAARGQYYPLLSGTSKDMKPIVNSAFVTDDGEELWFDMGLPFTATQLQAERIAYIEMEKVRSGHTISFRARSRLWKLQVGDRVTVTNTELGYSSKVFRVTDWRSDANGSPLLVLQEDAASIWDHTPALVPDPTPNTALPSPFVVPAPTFTTLSDSTTLLRNGDGTVTPRIRVGWTLAAGSSYLSSPQAAVMVRWARVGVDPAGSWYETVQARPDEGYVFLAGVAAGNRVLVEMWLRNDFMAESPRVVQGVIVVGDTAAPANVSGLSASVVTEGVRLSWTGASDLDYDVTELRYGASWAAGSFLWAGKGDGWTWVAPPVGSYTIWAKHYDTSGNESATAQSVAVTFRAGGYRAVAVGSSATTQPTSSGFYNAETGSSLYSGASSYRVTIFNRSNGAIVSSTVYDVAASAANAATMASALNALGSDRIVCVQSHGNPAANRLTNNLPAAMKRCGASSAIFESSNFKVGSAYILIGIAGCGEGNGFEAYQGSVDSDTNAWCDAYFTINSQGHLAVTGTTAVPRSIQDYGYLGDLNATRDVSLVNRAGTLIQGNRITKVSGGSAWNASATSTTSYVGGAYAEATVPATGNAWMFGLNSDPLTSNSYTDIDYAIQVKVDGNVDVWENAANAASNITTYVAGDVFAVHYDGEAVHYLKNGVRFYVNRYTPRQARLHFDCSLYYDGQYIEAVRFNPGPTSDSRSKNLIDASWWAPGWTPSGYWRINSSSIGAQNNSTNSFLPAIMADGSIDTVWTTVAGAGGTGQPAGGWELDTGVNYYPASGQGQNFVPIDPTRTYMFTIPVRKTNAVDSGSGARIYVGCGNGGDYAVCGLNSSTVDTNPYFAALFMNQMEVDTWYLVVGYIFPAGRTGLSHEGAGVWNMKTGKKVPAAALSAGPVNFNFAAASRFFTSRVYQYYTLEGQTAQFGRPQLYLCDGSEPFISDLLPIKGTDAIAPGAVVPSRMFIPERGPGTDITRAKAMMLTASTESSAFRVVQASSYARMSFPGPYSGEYIGQFPNNENVAYGFAAIKCYPGEKYRLRLRLSRRFSGTTGFYYVRMGESDGSAFASNPSARKWIGLVSIYTDPDVVDRTSYTDLTPTVPMPISGLPVDPGVDGYATLEYTYTVPAGVYYFSPTLYSWCGGYSNCIQLLEFTVQQQVDTPVIELGAVGVSTTGAANALGLSVASNQVGLQFVDPAWSVSLSGAKVFPGATLTGGPPNIECNGHAVIYLEATTGWSAEWKDTELACYVTIEAWNGSSWDILLTRTFVNWRWTRDWWTPGGSLRLIMPFKETCYVSPLTYSSVRVRFQVKAETSSPARINSAGINYIGTLSAIKV